MFILCVWVFVCTQSHGCQSGCVSPWIWSYGQLQAITSVLEIEPGFFARTTCVLNHQATSKLFFFFNFLLYLFFDSIQLLLLLA